MRRTLVGLAAALVACARTSPQPIDLAARESELLRTNRAAEARARSGDFVGGLSGLFATSGAYVAAAPLGLKGPSGARTWMERDTLNAKSKAMWDVQQSGVSADGRDGYTYGYLDVVHPAGDTLYGQYHAYWRREDDGQWRILAFSRGPRGAGPMTAPPRSAGRPRGRASIADTVANLKAVYATEAEFADSVGVDVGRAFAEFAELEAGKLNPPASSYGFGREAIRSMFAGAPPGGPLWRPEAGSVAASGDLAFTFGPAWPRSEGPTPKTPPRGRYFTIWRLQRDGTWRYVVD